ncbi:MAG TPA: HD domain-containing phosphohydrolase [Roseiflexaceae bacterium]|nr:HD domain-containing phosphohydrolase [Roseiflexaceae bacterium]
MTTAPQSTILIVDDLPDSREILEDILTSPQHRVLLAASGQEALLQAVLQTPDLVLLDVMMPGMDGFEVCRRLRADPRTAEMPVILITALDDREARLRGFEAGADEFITKPVDRNELRARVRTIMRLNRYRALLEERRRSDEQAQRAAAEISQAYDLTLEGWAHALDLRDKETEGHSRRVTELTVRLARMLGMDEEAITHVRRGALLHDIGKLGIPDRILLKPGKLTEEEWAVMRMHPVYAYEWLAPIAFLRPALDIPYCHHERWDGAGYPRGLAGEAIPLAARIFAVVDVWDAMTNDRPYRAALPTPEVFAHIRSQAGRHFDPQVVEAFLALQVRPGA